EYLAGQWKQFGKPVIVTEQGNVAAKDPASRPAEVGGCWDPTSHTRMRIRIWSCLFQQISLVFWNTSTAKDGWYMNIWLGPRERQYLHAMHDFAYCLGGGVRPVPVTLSSSDSVRAYGLASKRRSAVYLHHFKNYTTTARD